MAWHGDPALLRRDGYSGDYGIGLYGYWKSAASYLMCSARHGWVCVLCDVESQPPTLQRLPGCPSERRLRIVPRGPFGRKVYLAPLGLSFTVEGAYMVHIDFWPSANRIELQLMPYTAAPSAEATIFIDSESIEPPPLYEPRRYEVIMLSPIHVFHSP